MKLEKKHYKKTWFAASLCASAVFATMSFRAASAQSFVEMSGCETGKLVEIGRAHV